MVVENMIVKRLSAFFRNRVKDFLDCIKWAAISAAVVILITKVFVVLAFVPTGSMEPLVPEKSFMLCLRTDYWGSEPRRGDVIVFRRTATQDKRVYAKRIVGEPGDVVEIVDGDTYVNGTLYEESWLKETPEKINLGPFSVPEGHYFCMGDNRNSSYDCRYWEEHYIPREGVMARGHIVVNPDAEKVVQLIKYKGEEKDENE